MKILAYRLIPPDRIVSDVSIIRTTDLDEILNWLVFSHSSRYSSVLGVVWSLSDLFHLIESKLSPAEQVELTNPPHRARHGTYKIWYAYDKCLSINLNGSEVNFYDLSQYFPEDPEPSTLKGLQDKADELGAVLADLGIPSPSTLSSPVACFKGHKLLEGIQDTVPTVYDAVASQLEAYELALQCTPREWVSNYQVGYWPEGLWSYDLSSAYPSEASRLIDLRDCSFLKVDGGKVDMSAYYGWMVGDFTVYPDHPLAFCSPFLADRGDGVMVNFVGTKRDYPCLLDEVRLLYRYGLGEFKMSRGWFVSLIGGVHPRLPFKAIMDSFYSERDGSELQSYLVKRVMNGVIGKLLETRRGPSGEILEYGKLFNPIYHSICTTRTRLSVFEFLSRYQVQQSELVHVGVDGVKLSDFLPIPTDSVMGRWRLAGLDPAVVLSPGAILTSKRSFKGVSLQDLLSEIRFHPTASRYGPGGSIDLRMLFKNQTRDFPELPRTGGLLLAQTYQSGPVEIRE